MKKQLFEKEIDKLPLPTDEEIENELEQWHVLTCPECGKRFSMLSNARCPFCGFKVE